MEGNCTEVMEWTELRWKTTVRKSYGGGPVSELEEMEEECEVWERDKGHRGEGFSGKGRITG